MPKFFNIAGLLIIAAIFSCKKPYTPQLTKQSTNILVVEGVIVSNNDSTKIKLSRTVSLTDTTTAQPVVGATVTVESDQNSSYPLLGDTIGNYTAKLNLNPNSNYRVRIITQGKTYVSDFEPVKITPPIDSIGFVIKGNGLQIYANTHDPNSSTRYYRWDYAETWQFHPLYQSTIVSTGTSLITRSDPREVYDCWQTAQSGNVIIATSTGLDQDVIYQAPISLIPTTSEKIETRYSILLRQYALTKDAYNFWQIIKKNTESLGSIFDAQPSAIMGNIHNVADASENVLGYVGCSTVQTKRIFINNNQLPQTWAVQYPYKCELDSLLIATQAPIIKQFLINLPVLETTVRPIPGAMGGIKGYLYCSRQCADCTVRGSHTPPPFWVF